LSDLVRRYDSAYSMLIRCPWRIDSSVAVVVGSHMPNDNDGPMVARSRAICGHGIIAVTCEGPAFDLRLDFDNGHAIVLSCCSIGNDYDQCYSFGTPAGHYRVALDGVVGFEPAR
jgi:hypothetical protein